MKAPQLNDFSNEDSMGFTTMFVTFRFIGNLERDVESSVESNGLFDVYVQNGY